MAAPALPKRTHSLHHHASNDTTAATSLHARPRPHPPTPPPPVPDSPRPHIPRFSDSNNGPRYANTPYQPMEGLTASEERVLKSLLSGRQSDMLTLAALVEKYSKFFPLRIKVVKGFYTDRAAIPADDVYNIHFLKRSKVITVRDIYGDTYTIPYNSVITFGLLYEGEEDIKVFETAGDLMDAPTLPSVVIAQKSFDGKYSKTSVEEGEVLVLKGVNKSKFSSLLHNKGTIDAYSVSKMEEKTLHANCLGSFSTNPYSTRLHLPEIWKYIPEPTKLKARMFWDCDELDDLPSSLLNSAVSICGSSTESSLISRLVSDPTKTSEEALECVDDDDDEAKSLVDIPLSLNIEVVVVPPPKDRAKDLYTETRDIYDSFHPSNVTVCVDMPMDEMVVAQTQLFTTIRRGHESEGMDLQMPSLAYEKFVDSDDYEKFVNSDHSSGDEYEQVDFPRRAGNKSRGLDKPPPLPPPNVKKSRIAMHSGSCDVPESPPALPPPRKPTVKTTISPAISSDSFNIPPRLPPPNQNKEFGDSAKASPDLRSKKPDPPKVSDNKPKRAQETLRKPDRIPETSDSSQHTPPKSPKFVKATRLPDRSPTTVPKLQSKSEDPAAMRQELNQLASLVTKLQSDMEQLREEVTALSKHPKTIRETGGDQSQTTENLEKIAALTQTEVLQLLEQLGLTEHQQTFSENGIDGEILLECDESILKEDLGVQKRLHVLKLIKVISGRYSFHKILDGDGSYVAFDPN